MERVDTKDNPTDQLSRKVSVDLYNQNWQYQEPVPILMSELLGHMESVSSLSSFLTSTLIEIMIDD